MRYLYILTIFYLSFHFLIAQNIQNTSIKQNNAFNSKRLIEYYNKIRKVKSLPEITHDSLLDIVSNEVILNDKKYRKSTNSFNEDSIRLLFYNKGVIDYKYELFEVADSDTVSAFVKFFMSDVSNNIRCGYSKKDGKNLLIKTQRYLEYGYAEISVSYEVDELNPKSTPFKAPVDSIKYHVKAFIPGKYRFYYSDRIPLSSNKSKKEDFTDITEGEATNPPDEAEDYSDFNLVIKSKHPYKFIVIENEKKELTAIIK